MATFAQPQKVAHALEPQKVVVPEAVPALAAAATVTAPAHPAAAVDAAAVFPHMADGPATSALAEPKKVKTQTITPDTAPLLQALGTASGLTRPELPLARSTAGHLLEESAASGVINPNQYAYELATARRESHLGNWPNEFGGNAYFEKKYGYKSKHRDDLGNVNKGDGAKYHGRGLVQVTGRRNYTDWTDRLADENFLHNGEAVDLVNHPELAADPRIAAHIAVEGSRLGTFTGRKLGDYINDKQTDYYNARRVINGTDHAQEIADQATSFQHVIEQHSGEYTNAVLKTQLKNLPSAHEATLTGGAPATLPAELLAPERATTDAGKFVRPDKLLSNSIGHFDNSVPLGKYTTVKAAAPATPVVTPEQAVKTEPAT